MSLTASTCITFNGYEPLGNTLYLYSNYDNFSSSFGSVLTDDITGNNCPYIISGIPDGTTSIQFRDPQSLCCTTIFLQNNNLCVNCNLSITNYLQETVSQLVAGFLVGDCDDNISDYIIKWYKTGNTEVVFTTGYGTEFADIGWDLTHPLTGNSSPIVEPGVYYPVIDRVIINDITYSNSGETGTFSANLNCFQNQTINVDALRCDNGNNLGDYSHHYLFDNVSVGVEPESLSASFYLSANTNYLAWRFKGLDVEDRLKMIYYGSSYGDNPIVIEDIVVGSIITETNFNNNTIPKSGDTDTFFAKVTCFTAFTISEGDYVTIQITPNPINNNTKWDFYFTCLETFDCSTCLDNFKNSPYKIITSSITVTNLSCNQVQIFGQFSGCSFDEWSQSDTYKYFYSSGPSSFSSVQLGDIFSTQLRFDNITCSQLRFNNNDCYPPNISCSNPSNNTITYQKNIINNQGLIQIEFSSFSDLQHYYNSYQTVISYIGVFTDNTQLNYYRYFSLKLPIPQNINETCGDTTIYNSYDIHCTSVVTTGGTGPYFMTLTMPTIVKNINFTDCELNCDSNIVNSVNSVNLSSLSSSNNINVTTNVGSRYQYPFYCGKWIYSSTNSVTAQTFSGFFRVTKYANETVPYSGNSNTLLTSLSAQTCDFENNSVIQYYQYVSYWQYIYQYKIEIFDPNNVTNFRIYGSPITNFQYSGSTPYNYTLPIYELALEYSGGTITYSNSNYCI